MEFTIGGRIRRRGTALIAVGAAMVAGAVAWLVSGRTDGWAGPSAVLGFGALAVAGGARELARLRRPFRLHVDAFGLTLHDAEVSWEQVDAIALEYPAHSGDDEGPTPRPKLVLWPAPGVSLPRKADGALGDTALGRALAARLGLPASRVRYTLVDTADLDQGVGQLTEVLARHAGARFETAPRAVRPATPVTVSGPEGRVPGGEHVFTAHSRSGAYAVLFLACAGVLTLPALDVAATGHLPVPVRLLAVWFLAAAASWWAGVRFFRRWRRPLRLRIGPGGIGAREPAAREFHISWPDIAAVTVGPQPLSSDSRPWLVVWPLPGCPLTHKPTRVVDGHRAFPLLRLDRLPSAAPTLTAALHAYAGERLSVRS